MAFRDRAELRSWLQRNHGTSPGLLVRMQKKHSGVPGVAFADVLDEGLCFGWSESTRLPGDADSYLQQFTPRRNRGTTSTRNLRHAEQLIEQGLMTDAGRHALGLPPAASADVRS
jgi:uncharacterized protein YdeI (YjbR/CyaY-like superfamily)